MYEIIMKVGILPSSQLPIIDWPVAYYDSPCLADAAAVLLYDDLTIED